VSVVAESTAKSVAADGNSIVSRENDAEGIKHLRAARHMYAVARRVVTVQVVLAIGAPLLAAVVGLIAPERRAMAAFTALVVAVLDVALWDPWQKRAKKKAAKVQESFDCYVLDMPWNEFRAGSRVDAEEIHAADIAHLSGKTDPSLANWYPSGVSALQMHVARIICQRTNLWWDGSLRRFYSAWVVGGVMVLTLGALLIGVAADFTLEWFVLGVMAPAAPLLLWGIREIYRQRDAADSLEQLKAGVEKLWERTMKGECDTEGCKAESRLFQNEILDRRASSPMIFEWVYLRLRPKMEGQMVAGADAHITEAKGKGFGALGQGSRAEGTSVTPGPTVTTAKPGS
jgi:hypothetical protein